jgi:septum site-determining protein MinC
MSSPIAIKGIREGLLITVPEGEWEQIEPALLETIDQRGDFFHGANVVLQLGERELRATEMGRLRDRLTERDVALRGILSESPVTKAAAADLGLALKLKTAPRLDEDETLSFETELAGETAVLVQRTLRSGHSIHHPGHVVVIGDVNPGCEIVAGGNIVVWGRLRGVVHAGAAGNEAAVVCALDLAPTQLRIAGHIAVSPERRGRPGAEIAFVRDGQLIAETWKRTGRR